ncbi:hypothetical protein ASG67_14315 [Sphingomonas sp. Leaf339]|uniref:DUF2332 domain-containing protein n=1 Tax=Sphingomonas sp. Leaf339 TaxID=1736343 RepID=UPI0006F27069|nr:DUF2332 domain-containing protein [Sphingomonas sp. Leaf339]KQU47424.1 hypothetical protein ASG67_14315 [Sphingomonas sp. Leaf339]
MTNGSANRAAFGVQAGYCAAMGAPVTARVCTALVEAIDRRSATGRRVLDWAGEPVADALALRLVGGLHALHRAGVYPALSAVFAGDTVAEPLVRLVLQDVMRRHDAALLPWLDGPPQTNEAARSAGLMTGMLHLAARFGPRIEVLEIGSSAGLNLLVDRFRFDLGGVVAGPAGAAVTIRPDWRGPPPPAVPIEIVSTRGVDVAPVDVRDPAAAERLAAYVWVDAVERQARLAATVAMIRADGVALDRGDAADWIEARLAEPQEAGVTRVLMHSVVWQYLGNERRARIRDAMAAAGARATAARPLGWVMMEPNRDLHRHEVRVRGWPGDTPMELVALTHAHGAWVEGLAPPYETRDYVMMRGPYDPAGR